jgi:hypothetical protein
MSATLVVLPLIVFAFLVPAGLLVLLDRMRQRWAGVGQPGVIGQAFPTMTASSSMLMVTLAGVVFLSTGMPSFLYPIVALSALTSFVNGWFGYVILTPTHVSVRRNLLDRRRDLPLANLRDVTVGYAIRTPPIWVTDSSDDVHHLGHLRHERSGMRANRVVR